LNNKRNPILAGFLNLICTGLGFLYVGKLKYACALFGIYIFMALVIIKTKLIFNITILYISIFVALLILISSIIFAGYLAKGQQNKPLKRYQRWYIYVGYALIVSIMNNIIVENRGMLLGYETYNIPSGSMIPTLLIGDFIIVDTDAYNNNEISRGDVIIFRYPEDPSTPFVMRVIGIPEDKIEYKDKIVRLNDKEITQKGIEKFIGYGSNARASGAIIHNEISGDARYQILNTPDRRTVDLSIIVPSEHFFVLGDNRDNSKDSRYWGFVPKENLIGKAKSIWFHWDNTNGIEFSRLGKSID
jgi:signal peptidase I